MEFPKTVLAEYYIPLWRTGYAREPGALSLYRNYSFILAEVPVQKKK
jgi:hypothetical protein